MITLKQAEAFYWTATLGSVVEASTRLNVTQSTLSKRLLELEGNLGAALFDRTRQSIGLTRLGRTLVPSAAELLHQERQFRAQTTGPLALSGSFRFGVTELVALTWLPKLILSMKKEFPNLVPEPEINSSAALFARLAERRLDLAIGLDPPRVPAFEAVPLRHGRLQWMCAPHVGPVADRINLAEIAKYPILTQGEHSGLQRLVVGWLRAKGITLNRAVTSDSLSVLSALAIAGLGITYLNEQYFQPELKAGRLRIIRTSPAIPIVRYFAVFSAGGPDPLARKIAQIAKDCCDFSLRSS
jgi:DNA-binding transcriptional LysR family regulator